MEVKIYSINNCQYCTTLKEILDISGVSYEEIKVLRMGEEGEGISFSKYMELEPTVPLIQRCNFPQVYIDGEYTGDIKSTLRYLRNGNK
jgi:glutaredoxin